MSILSLIINFLYIYPGVALVLTSMLAIYIPKKTFSIIVLLSMVCALFLILNHNNNTLIQKLFAAGLIFAFIPGFLFASSQNDNLLNLTTYIIILTVAISAILAKHAIEMFIMYELVSIISSLVLYLKLKNTNYKSNALFFIVMHLIGGMLFLYGLVNIVAADDSYILFKQEISFNISNISLTNKELIISICLSIGFLIKTASLPFSKWLEKTYPNIDLSSFSIITIFTTKLGIYCFLAFFKNHFLLFFIGAATFLYSTFHLFIKNNLREYLSYFLILQSSIILILFSLFPEHKTLIAFYAFSHLIYNSLFFVGFSAIMKHTTIKKYTELNNLFSESKFLFFVILFGCLCSSGIPFTIGYISKTLFYNNIDNNLYLISILFFANIIILPWNILYKKDNIKICDNKATLPSSVMASLLFSIVLCILTPIFTKINSRIIFDSNITLDLYSFINLIKQCATIILAIVTYVILYKYLYRAKNTAINFKRKYFISKLLINIYYKLIKAIFSNFNIIKKYTSDILNKILCMLTKFNTPHNLGNSITMLTFCLAIFIIYCYYH